MVACWQRSAGFAFTVNGRPKFVFLRQSEFETYVCQKIMCMLKQLKLDLPVGQNSLVAKSEFWSSQMCLGVNGTVFFMSNANSNNSLCCYFRKQEALLQDSKALAMNYRLL